VAELGLEIQTFVIFIYKFKLAVAAQAAMGSQAQVADILSVC
jgi:hypothetical protein